MNKQLLKQIIREEIQSLMSGRKKLRVLDFDDTLVKTNSYVIVKHSDGRRSRLTPAQYAVYVQKPGDVFDYSAFDIVDSPRENKPFINILRNIISAGGDNRGTFILTARAKYEPIKEYLKQIGITGVRVIALAGSDPQKKADWIEKQIDEFGYNDVYFADDSESNILAVKKMLQKKGVRHKISHVRQYFEK